jgi:hypothetical protein
MGTIHRIVEKIHAYRSPLNWRSGGLYLISVNKSGLHLRTGVKLTFQDVIVAVLDKVPSVLIADMEATAAAGVPKEVDQRLMMELDLEPSAVVGEIYQG